MSSKEVITYAPIVFETVAVQAGADHVYQYWANQGTETTAPRKFKSDAERMQYILGKQKQAGCGVGKRNSLQRTNQS
jgi:hypothetical protein